MLSNSDKNGHSSLVILVHSREGEKGLVSSLLFQLMADGGREERTTQGRRVAKFPHIYASVLHANTFTYSQILCLGWDRWGILNNLGLK